jgi:tRNA pseudouridine55 synthase
MDALLVIDKPLHMTSFDVVARVRRLTGERRIGHAGTLDPLASGVLVLCLGEATKLVPYLMDADKEYLATARLGLATDTDDADPQAGVLSAARPSQLAALTESQIRAALASQVGWVQQRPPRFSALKIDGQRLYDKARKARGKTADCGPDSAGDPVAERAAQAAQEAGDAIEQATAQKTRPVRIDEIVIESLRLWPAEAGHGDDAPVTRDQTLPEVVFRVRCGKGTYVRSLARDLGEALGVGAHLSSLRRLRVGRFDLQGAVPPEEARRAPTYGLLSAVAHLPQLHVDADEAQRLRWGQPAVLRDLAPRLRACLQPMLASQPDRASLAVAAIDPRGQLLAILSPLPATGDADGSDLAQASFQIARGFVDKLPAEVTATGARGSAVGGEPCITDCA